MAVAQTVESTAATANVPNVLPAGRGGAPGCEPNDRWKQVFS